MSYTSVFQHGEKGIYGYKSDAASLAAARAFAKSVDGNEHFGQHLYTRPSHQVLMRTGERYVIRFGAASRFCYRRHDEDLFGALDYYMIGDHGYDTLDFLVTHPVIVPEANVESEVRMRLRFRAARAHKFQDFCKENLIAIEFEEGKAYLRGYKTWLDTSPVAQIELDIIR